MADPRYYGVVVVVVVVGIGVLRTNQVSAYGRSPLDQGKWRSDRDAARRTVGVTVASLTGSLVLQGH